MHINFGVVARSHLKFDPNTGTDVRLPQPCRTMYDDIVLGRNQLNGGPDFDDPLSLYTLSALKTKNKNTVGLLQGTSKYL